MGSRLGRRVVHFANLPLKIVLPTTTPRNNKIREFALRTIPSATKFEIKSVLESLYGFDVEEVRTLNMEGKKKKRGGILLSQPDYKKAYITLRHPLPFPQSLFPLPILEQERNRKLQDQKKGRFKSTILEEEEKVARTKHWLDPEEEEEEIGRDRWDRERRGGRGKVATRARNRARAMVMEEEEARGGVFPWGETRTLRR